MNAEFYNKIDHSSLSNSTQATVVHIDLTWNVDFDRKIFEGCVVHTVQILVDGTAEVHFDSSNIHLAPDENAVTLNDEPVAVRFESPNAALGTRMAVPVPEHLRAQGSNFTIAFCYSIDPEATAVQWLPAESTKGGVHPFVFTQCQAIHARSLLPCMDSPSVKATYSATVTAPAWCQVLMSALPGESSLGDELSTFVWTQPVPTPAYLIALAAGRMSSKDVSHRVRIWAEPEVIDAAYFEFSETEDFVKQAEEITGCAYQWTRYDVLCLPPSFPYGGMENPCLTFATPTLLAGDKSLADVIAHEIAHSWTGNLVTNHTWDHFWLNEGWTVWLERKITSRFKNNDEVGKLSAQVHSCTNNAVLLCFTLTHHNICLFLFYMCFFLFMYICT
jgi:leukotriene-A4 hydrolase